ncbi:MAG: hypothetical protein WD055_05685 [Candidatus Dependentiae bacterium]
MKKLALLALVPCALLAKGENPLSDLPQLAFNPVSAKTAKLLVKKVVQEQAEKWASEVEGEVTGDRELLNQSGVKVSTADLARFAALVGVDCAYDGLNDLSQGDVREAVKAGLKNALLHTESRTLSAALKTAWSILSPFNLSLINFEERFGPQVGSLVNHYVRDPLVDEFLNNVVKYVIANHAPWHKLDSSEEA